MLNNLIKILIFTLKNLIKNLIKIIMKNKYSKLLLSLIIFSAIFLKIHTDQLHDAVKDNDFEHARNLIEFFETNINAVDEDNKTPLHHATNLGYLNIINLLIEHGADLYAEDNDGKKPFEHTPEWSAMFKR